MCEAVNQKPCFTARNTMYLSKWVKLLSFEDSFVSMVTTALLSEQN